MDKNEEIVDVFENVRVKWAMICRQCQTSGRRNTKSREETPRSEIRSYEMRILSFDLAGKLFGLDGQKKRRKYGRYFGDFWPIFSWIFSLMRRDAQYFVNDIF